jgi:hypothetical protein
MTKIDDKAEIPPVQSDNDLSWDILVGELESRRETISEARACLRDYLVSIGVSSSPVSPETEISNVPLRNLYGWLTRGL